jgi:riboflavin kinase/FMN adenylyltransferase
MQVLHTFAELPPAAHLAIGVFDGVHLGHQHVIAAAGAAGAPSVVLTFDPHPMRVLRPSPTPLLLTSTNHKLRLLQHLGVDACLVIHFDQAFSEIPAEKFVEHLATCRQICVGSRFHFGHDRRGDVHLLEQLAPRYGFTVQEIQSVVTADGEMISSTAIRQHIQAGHLDQAAAMLGRPFSVLGTVEPGDHRGATLGFPTANLNPQNEILPPHGVYAVRASITGRPPNLPAVANIGVRPTFAGTSRRLEVHILNHTGNLYGAEMEVTFVSKIRDEQKFATVDELKRQIAADITVARGRLTP